ncbi:MAG: hypothetical protein ABSB49_03130 [Polyangia bacterium]|jgi:hypothetical protein
MTHSSAHKIRLLSWRTLRWVVVLPLLPLVWWACISHPLTQPLPNPQQESNVYITVAPSRKLDMVFMIDDSPSMAPKQAKMKAQFPKLITALQDPNTGALPDLQIAIIDSDMGAGGRWSSAETTNCIPDSANNNNIWGDEGHFQMVGAAACGVTDTSKPWLISPIGGAANFTGNIADVFGCLATNLGTNGCGEEHQLQAFEMALGLTGADDSTDQSQRASFVRSDAFLGLVFLTDEDDCSTYPNDGLFGNTVNGVDLANTETASLRCSTRGYQCNGSDLSSNYPTTQDFSTPNFGDCVPRPDSEYCPSALDGVTGLPGNVYDTGSADSMKCNPLTNYKRIANEIKSLKSSEDKILVAGIFGYTLQDGSHEPIKFAKHGTPPTSTQPNPAPLYDYWSYCYDPNNLPNANSSAYYDATTGWDQNAWGNGAGPGIRENAFLDEFKNSYKFSVCEADYSNALKAIGAAIETKLQNLCVPYKLWNTQPSSGTLVPDCHVNYLYPATGQASPQTSALLPMCQSGATQDNISTDCWQLVQNSGKCAGQGQLDQYINIIRTAAEVAAGPIATDTQVQMECMSCTSYQYPAGSNAPAVAACNY